MVLLDFPKSGASDFNDFCTLSGIIFNILFLIDFESIFDRFVTSFWHPNRSSSDKKPPEAFKKTCEKQLKKKYEKKSRNRCDRREIWALGPLKDLRNQDGHPQTIPRATDQQDPKPVTSKGLINTPSVPKGTVADICISCVNNLR